MNAEQVQAARKAFEAPFSDRMERYETGGYVNELINEQWIGYRAAWERLQKIVDDREAEIALLGTELQRQAASLTAERDRYRDTLLSRHGGECLALLDELDEARERIADLTRELAACAKDAVRYRWLRDPSGPYDHEYLCVRGQNDSYVGADLDRAVDVAIDAAYVAGMRAAAAADLIEQEPT